MKKSKTTTHTANPAVTKENITAQPISTVLRNNYMPYAMSVIISRAIPEIDGFKPAHRKLLYTMYKMGLLGGTRTKSANIVGQTMKLNPHGDQAIYETMVRLAKSNESLLCPLVDSKGNFGKHYSRDMAYAASRYTEAKLTKICSEFFQEIDQNAVDMVDNYDGTMKEPSLLPVPFPLILTNPTMGIAVGMASNICSFNLAEVCQATISRLKSPNKPISEIIQAPDFPTGGDIIYDKSEMNQIIETGKGSIRVRGRYRVDKKNKVIEIYEIPYSTTSENIIEDVIDLIKKGYFTEITGIRDETDLKGLKIAIDYKQGVDPDALMRRIYKNTKLEDTFGCNFNILIDGKPDVLGIPKILDEWTKWRRSCINRILAYELEQKTRKKMLLEGLQKISLNINKAVKIIKDSADAEVVPNLMNGFKINEDQAEYVADIKLRNINKEYILEKTKEIEALEKRIAEINQSIGNDKKLNAIIIKQLENIAKKYGQPRRTGIIDAEDVIYEDDTPAEDTSQTKIVLTQKGYLKLVSPAAATSSIKLQDGDEVLLSEETKMNAELLLFTSGQNIYKAKISSFKSAKPSEIGEYIPAAVGFDRNEEIKGAIVTADFKGNAILCFENGKVARVPLSAYQTKTNRKKLVNAITDTSPLLKAGKETKHEIQFITSNSRGISVSPELISTKTTKNTQGVQVVRLGKSETVSKVYFDGNSSYITKQSSTIPVAPKPLK